MTNPEGAFLPPRRRSSDYIPIDEVSTEDVDPTLDWTIAKSPEDQAIELEEREEREKREDQGWQGWLNEQLLADSDKFDEWGDERGENDRQYRERMAELGPQGKGYEDRFGELASDYKALGNRPEDFNDFVDRFGLPQSLTRRDVDRLVGRQIRRFKAVAEKKDTMAIPRDNAHPPQKPRGKRESGEKPVARFDWKSNLPEDLVERLEQDVKKNGGETSQNRETFDAEMNLIADYAHLENRAFKNNSEMISWGQKRNYVDSLEAERLQSIFG